MSLTRMLAIAKKEVMQILRDTRSLIIVVIMPGVLVLLFGYGVNLDLKDCPFMSTTRTAASRARICSSTFRRASIFILPVPPAVIRN